MVISQFSHAENGMTRFPPNIEQLSVQRDSTITWLVARRNDLELRSTGSTPSPSAGPARGILRPVVDLRDAGVTNCATFGYIGNA